VAGDIAAHKGCHCKQQRRKPVEEVGRCGDGLGPVLGRHASVNEQGANAIVESSEAALGFAILLGGVRAQETQVNATGCKHSGEGMIEELGVVMSLNRFDGKAELCLDNAAEVGEMISNLRFLNKGKRLAKMCEIIKNDEVILGTRNTRYRRCPNVTMN